jgi:hypothetical protein
MITSSQKTDGCIALNKLKLLISEAAYIYDLKSLYTTIETSIDAAAAGGGESSDDADAGGGASTSTSAPSESGAAEEAAEPCTDISITWFETKMSELKSEINLTLTEISNQIRNNI